MNGLRVLAICVAAAIAGLFASSGYYAWGKDRPIDGFLVAVFVVGVLLALTPGDFE